MNTRNKIIFGVIALIAAVTLIIIYGTFNPESKFFPKCIFYVVTGWKCPGCGTQRAIHSLLIGDFSAALGYNAMMIFFLPVIAILWVAALVRLRYPRFYNAVNSRPIILATLFIVVGWGILRNIFDF